MKKLPIGISDFKEIIEKEYLFVDTSQLIGKILNENANAILITRPRRFGKTLNMSMLSYFFDNSLDSSDLFKGLMIAEDEEVMKEINGYPTIFITFKDIKDHSWEEASLNLKNQIISLYKQKKGILEKLLKDKDERRYYRSIVERSAPLADYKESLKSILGYLASVYNKPVLLLIDEYDVPIQSGWTYGYYDEVIDFMRIFLSAALKDNPNLFRGVLTGIYRVAKESIFSGLNNLKVYTIMDEKYSEYFGFTELEVDWITNEAGKGFNEEFKKGMREWYNGYSFGGKTIYNPWSVINYLCDGVLKPYWINTSGNDLIISLVEENLKKKGSFREEIETIISGKPLEKIIDDSSALREISRIPNAIWSLFLFSGYLKAENAELERGKYRCNLMIPNEEVKIFFQDTVINWLNGTEYEEKFSYMTKALVSGEAGNFCISLKEFVSGTLSYYDISKAPENTYHILLLGIFAQLQGKYWIKSNRESGLGRYDILLKAKDKSNYSAIIEIKKSVEDLEKALKQIDEKDYSRELKSEGYDKILKVAIGADGKSIETMVG